MYFKGIHLCRHLDSAGLQSVFLAVLYSVHGSDEGGYVAPGLPREVFVDGPEIPAAAPADRLVHVAGTAVVGGDSQAPVPEEAVGVFEVPGCRVGRLERVKAFVDVGIDLEPVGDGCPVHELPHSLGTGP